MKKVFRLLKERWYHWAAISMGSLVSTGLVTPLADTDPWWVKYEAFVGLNLTVYALCIVAYLGARAAYEITHNARQAE